VAAAEEQSADKPEMLDVAVQGYRQLGDLGAAERVQRAAVERNPQNAAMLENFGNILSAQGKQSDAASAYERALALDSGNTRVLERLVPAYLKLKRFEEAERGARALLTLRPDDARIHYYLASALRQAKRRREALEHAMRAAELEPANERYRKTADDLARPVVRTAKTIPSGCAGAS
jgi:tetratricopeptide (TPR) repeat protein